MDLIHLSSIKLVPYFLIAIAIIASWWRQDIRLWGPLFLGSLIMALVQKQLRWAALVMIAIWIALWFFYLASYTKGEKWVFFSLIVLGSFILKFHWIKGFNPLAITTNIRLGFDSPIVGLLPLFTLVPLIHEKSGWKKLLRYDLLPIVAAFFAMMALMVIADKMSFHFRWPIHAPYAYLVNLLFVVIPEEAFYRGFIQRELTAAFGKVKGGRWISLCIATLLFTLAHFYWARSLLMLLFVAIAGTLYGLIYMRSGRVESAIVCHFLVNALHQTCFARG